jgi:hypothetical protein
MEFVLVGFKEGDGVRRFAFDCVRADRTRTKVIVRADVTLARKHEIRLQELPLLCRRLLESVPEDDLETAITFTEDHMIAIQAAARVLLEKKPHKAPRPSAATGQAWRNLQL